MEYDVLMSLLKSARRYGKLKSKTYKLNSSESIICAYVYFNEPVTQEAIARAQMMDKTTVAKALKQLESKNYIYRQVNPKNRRENMIFLAEQGKEEVKQITEEQKQWFEAVSEDIEEEELKVFFEVANKMLVKSKQLLEEEEEK